MTSMPNTLIAGAGKSGTTSLCDDLALHPDVYLYHSKETNYFSFNHHRGEDWFRSLFTPGAEKIILDGSPDYTTRARTAEIFDRIKKLLPQAQLIFMVRHPVKRLESSYIQELANGRTPLPFAQAVQEWDLLLDGSLYEKAHRIITDRFEPEQLHTLFFEDYLADKAQALRDLFAFLGIVDHPDCYAHRAASNTRDTKIMDPTGIKKLRKLPGYYRLKGLFPSNLKSHAKHLIGQRIKAEIDWTPNAWDHVEKCLREDAKAFLTRHGKPIDFWDIELPPENRTLT